MFYIIENIMMVNGLMIVDRLEYCKQISDIYQQSLKVPNKFY